MKLRPQIDRDTRVGQKTTGRLQVTPEQPGKQARPLLQRLQSQLVRGLLYLACIPLAIFGVLAFFASTGSYHAEVYRQVTALAEIVATRATDAVSEAHKLLEVTARSDDAVAAPSVFGRRFTPEELQSNILLFFSPGRFRKGLAAQKEQYPIFSSLLCVRPADQEDADGQRAAFVLYASEEEREGRSVLPDFWRRSGQGLEVNPRYLWSRQAHQPGVAGEPPAGAAPPTLPTPSPFDDDGHSVLAVAVPYRDGNGQPVALVGLIELEALQSQIEAIPLGERRLGDARQSGDTVAVVLDAQGRVLAGVVPPIATPAEVAAAAVEAVRREPEIGRSHPIDVAPLGIDAFIGVAQAPAGGWRVVALLEEGAATGTLDRFRVVLSAVTLAAVLLVLAVGLTISNRVTRPVEQLMQGIERYVSPELVGKIDSPDALVAGTGLEREVSVLFLDIRGFTRLSEQMSAEQVVKLLVSFFNRVSRPVVEMEGAIDKFIGDAMMAVFGFPLDQPDHALRAVRAAILIRKVHEVYNQEREDFGKERVEIGIGVNTGRVVAGSVGCDFKLDYTVIGDPVNVASRLCGAAEAREVLISAATYEQVKDQVEAQFLGERTVRGREGKIGVYAVTGLKEAEAAPAQTTG